MGYSSKVGKLPASSADWCHLDTIVRCPYVIQKRLGCLEEGSSYRAPIEEFNAFREKRKENPPEVKDGEPIITLIFGDYPQDKSNSFYLTK